MRIPFFNDTMAAVESICMIVDPLKCEACGIRPAFVQRFDGAGDHGKAEMDALCGAIEGNGCSAAQRTFVRDMYPCRDVRIRRWKFHIRFDTESGIKNHSKTKDQ